MKRKNKIDPTEQKIRELLDDLTSSRDIYQALMKSEEYREALKYYNDRFNETAERILKLIKKGA